MALAGDEKRIRALFSELALEDRRTAPNFATVWNRAQSRATNVPAASVRRTRFTAAIAFTAVTILAAGAFFVWSWSANSRQSPAENALNFTPQVATPPTPTPAPSESRNSAPAKPRIRSHVRHQRTIQPAIRSTELTAAAEITRWQSPTTYLMTSPTEVSFNSLPQLNESAEKLKQFLPKNNEATKESNR